MRYYESFSNINNDKTLIGEEIYAFKKYDGQNFVAKYNTKKEEFIRFGSRTRIVNETDEQFGAAIILFREKIEPILLLFIRNNKQIFNVKEIEFYFEYVGENSFCGVHNQNDEMHLVLIDIWLYKKGYIEPPIFYELTKNLNIDVAEVVYIGKLTNDFILDIKTNLDGNNIKYPKIKEGVVCKATIKRKGQYLPKVKIKTNWWINKVKSKYPNSWENLI